MRSLLSFVSAAALLTSLATAQITQINNSGCPVASTQCKSGGTPGLGQQVGFKCAAAAVTDPTFLIFGIQINPGLPLNPPLMCGRAVCNLVSFEVASLIGPGGVSVTLTIPVDPSLVGACIAVQGGSINIGGGCVDLGPGYLMCIQP